MEREVQETYPDGSPKVIVYRDTPDEKAERRRIRAEQAERGRRVAASLRNRGQTDA